MSEEEIKIDQIENEEKDINEELNQFKKEMIEHIVDKMKESNKADAFLYIGKDLVVDYLLDEWEAEDKVNDFFLWMGINFFSNSANQLKNLREKIKNCDTKESLEALEKSIIESLDNQWNSQQNDTSTISSWWTVVWTAAASSASYMNSSQKESWDTVYTESTADSTEIWEAKEIPLKQRMQWLFPEWIPTKEKEMKKYLTKIKIPIITPEWKEKKLTLHVHKKLANEYKAIFQEMYDKWIPVNPKSTACFNWRKMRKWSKMSHHSYWSAIDINRDVNGWVYGKTDKSSPYYNDLATVDIWKKHGFYWWWDWSKNYNDPMHFTYMNW